MDEKTEKIDVIVDENDDVAEEGGPVEERKPRRRAACAGGAAALAAVAVACALMMQPADAVEVEGFAARAIIPQIPVGLDWAPQGESADEALPETGGAEEAAGEGGEQADASAEAAAEGSGAGAAAQPQQGASQSTASGSPAQAAPQGGSSSGSAAQPQQQPSQQAPAASQPSAPAHEHSWQPVTEPKWVVDKAAWDEKKQVGSTVKASCGKNFNSVEEWAAHGDRSHSCSYEVVPKYEIIHHDEIGHTEMVVTGHKCSCGATK